MKLPERFDMVVSVDMKTKRISLSGPLHLKALCIHALTDAINVVVDHQVPVPPPTIIKPQVGDGEILKSNGH